MATQAKIRSQPDRSLGEVVTPSEVNPCKWGERVRISKAAACFYEGISATPFLLVGRQERVVFIDITRGLLVVWMIIAHSLTVAAIHQNDLLQYLRPRGWASTSFIMLTGFTIAVVFSRNLTSKNATAAKLRRRAFKIGVIAFTTNLLFKGSGAWLNGHFSYDLLWRIITFREPWSISAFLIPTSLFLIATPAVCWLANRINARQLFALTTSAGILFDIIARLVWQYHGASVVFLQPFARAFSWVAIGYFVLYGLWGYALANMLKKEGGLRFMWPVIVLAALSILALASRVPQVGNFSAEFMLPAARFVIILEMVLILERIVSIFDFEGFLITLGRSALLVFVLHRPVVQAGGFILCGLMPDRAAALELMTLTLLGCYWLALMMKKQNNFSALLNSIGL